MLPGRGGKGKLRPSSGPGQFHRILFLVWPSGWPHGASKQGASVVQLAVTPRPARGKRMPVARIISPNFEDALKFADYLRPFFDTVEIAQPGRAYETIVDLEVNLQLCTPEQAWEQVAQLGTQPDTDIFVAPGTLVPPSEQESLNEGEDWQAEAVEDAFEAQSSAAEPAHAGAQNFNSAG